MRVKVAEASRLCTENEQRRSAAATTKPAVFLSISAFIRADPPVKNPSAGFRVSSSGFRRYQIREHSRYSRLTPPVLAFVCFGWTVVKNP